MKIQHFFDPRTSSITYVVSDGGVAVLIDPVLDYDPKDGRTFLESAQSVAAYLEAEGLDLAYALDTHLHADHLSALAFFKDRFGAKTGIGDGIVRLQEAGRKLFNLGPEFPTDGRQFDVLLGDGDVLEAGPMRIRSVLTEGHTPASLTYGIGDALFVGDLLFMPDSGTARCDFPGGSAALMFDAVQKLYQLPGETRVFTLHDYQPGGRELGFESTIGEQRRANVHLKADTSKDDFVALRKRLEEGKPAPTLLLPSLQVNIRAGQLPEPEENGTAYLKIPLNAFGKE